MDSVNYRYADWIKAYAAEGPSFRNLPLITRSVAAYIRKLVDPVTGTIPLHGREPWDSVRHVAYGETNRSDRRALKAIIPSLIKHGYLAIGPVVDGEFLPVGHGDHLGVTDWVAAQAGMDREQSAKWAAERARKADKWAADNPAVSPKAPRSDNEVTTTAPRSDNEVTTNEPRPCNETRVSVRNHDGTNPAVFRSVPFRSVGTTPCIPPSGDPLGSGAGSDAESPAAAGARPCGVLLSSVAVGPSDQELVAQMGDGQAGELRSAIQAAEARKPMVAFALSSDEGGKRAREREAKDARAKAWALDYFAWLDGRRRSLGLVAEGRKRINPHCAANLRKAREALRRGVTAAEAIRVSEYRQHGWHLCDMGKEQLRKYMSAGTLLGWTKFERAQADMPEDWEAPKSLCAWPEVPARRGRHDGDIRYGIAPPSPREAFEIPPEEPEPADFSHLERGTFLDVLNEKMSEANA